MHAQAITDYIPIMPLQQIVWLEVYKCKMTGDGIPSAHNCAYEAREAVISFNKLFNWKAHNDI